MIKVTLGNNVKRKSEILDENTTLREALEDAEIDYTTGIMNLDGSTLSPGDLDKTFADFGITEKCYLLNVVKADNAAAVDSYLITAFIKYGRGCKFYGKEKSFCSQNRFSTRHSQAKSPTDYSRTLTAQVDSTGLFSQQCGFCSASDCLRTNRLV